MKIATLIVRLLLGLMFTGMSLPLLSLCSTPIFILSSFGLTFSAPVIWPHKDPLILF